MTGFAELVAATHFSFLRGASFPSDMVARAMELGMTGIGIADRNSVAGVVRAHVAWREGRRDAEARGISLRFRLAVGARLVFTDGTPDIVAYPSTRSGWGRLTRMLTIGKRRACKGECVLLLDDLLGHAEDLLLIVLADVNSRAALQQLSLARPGSVWLGATMPRGGTDHRRLRRLTCLATETGIRVVATNDALYATPGQRPLQDVLTCIRERTTIHEAGRHLEPNAERHLKSPDEMARLLLDCPEAVSESVAILDRIGFDLDQLRYEYPNEPVPEGWTPQSWLEHLVTEAARKRYPDGVPAPVRATLDEEFQLVRDKGYACYFLTVYDVVRFAQSRGILCQGRGSAANSLICYLLGITSIDPVKHQLLFSRFVSGERNEPPDIDVDFEHERRELVMQYVYERYGRDRAGIAATVIHYRPRSAVREIGKVLGFTQDVTARLAETIWGSFAGEMEQARYAEAGIDLGGLETMRLQRFVREIMRFPRHLSQHVGGFVLTEGRLDEMVPILNGAMPGRTFIEWDKDDIDALGLMKVDVLALGMLTCIRKSFDFLNDVGGLALTLNTVPSEDPQVYEMLCQGDSVGVFQVESRAQINMLPRLKPRNLYDLAIQVAIVRPGPIEGDMVHPYLRRRAGREAVRFPRPAPPRPSDELEAVLGKTFGVPLFQEQAMRLAIVAAEFTPTEADRLRRAMATFRNVGGIDRLKARMIDGMIARGYERQFAERCYKQIEGFGSYGFPESHAQSFARLVYISSWIKRHHPAVFACALLNAQPMGFYAPAQIVHDARAHDVEIRPVDVNASGWNNGVELRADGTMAVRLGLRQITGFKQNWTDVIVNSRCSGPLSSVESLASRARLPPRALRLLADADAFGSIAIGRREALWDARRISEGDLPLFAATSALGHEPDSALPPMSAAEHVVLDYQVTRLSLKDHPLAFLRPDLAIDGVLTAAEIAVARYGMACRHAGLVLVRQRPGKGRAIFITLEDETGIVNVLIWARLFERFRRAVMAPRLMLVEGEVQRSQENVVHLIASRIIDRTGLLDRLSDDPTPLSSASHACHPRDARIVPRPRDFH